MDLFFLTAMQASELIRKREISPVDLVKACIRRIEALDDQVNAFITFTPEAALAEAKLASRISLGVHLLPIVIGGSWRHACHHDYKGGCQCAVHGIYRYL